MAKLSFTLTSAAGNVTYDGPTITDSQMTRFLDFVWDTYPQVNPDGTRKARSTANLAAAYRDWAAGVWAGTKANVRSYDTAKAEQTARAGITEIDT